VVSIALLSRYSLPVITSTTETKEVNNNGEI
jgi:hypothetical protein